MPNTVRIYGCGCVRDGSAAIQCCATMEVMEGLLLGALEHVEEVDGAPAEYSLIEVVLARDFASRYQYRIADHYKPQDMLHRFMDVEKEAYYELDGEANWEMTG